VRAIEASEIADPTSPARAAIERLVSRWLGARGMAPMGFLVDVKPFAFPEERRYFVAETADATVGFLAAVPVYARRGWLFEDLLRDPSAPNGTAEVLVDAAMKRVAAEGARYVTLGLAPLAGDVQGSLRRLRAWTRALYDFEGVRAFKAKLRPHAWDPIHMAWPRGESARVALLDALAAFARGSFTRFGVDTLLQGPTFVVRALAVLLVPWTVLLALSDARHWFPSAWVKYAWVGFDACVALALLWLAARWRRWLGVLLAALVTGDALVTLSEALAYNVERAHRALDWSVIVASCVAPAFAATVLWGAVKARASLVGTVAKTRSGG
jgi:phosphatidylglycerol lysyltransferase